MSYVIPPTPYAVFSDTTTQTTNPANTPQVITLNTDEFKNAIVHSTSVNPGRITIPTRGLYFVSFSAITSANAIAKFIEIWPRINGVDVPRSNTRSQLPNANVERAITVTYIFQFNSNDYIEFWMAGSDTTMSILAVAAVGTMANVISPSIIVTINKVGE